MPLYNEVEKHFNTENSSSLNFFSVDGTKEEMLSTAMNVKSYPSIYYFDGSKFIEGFYGKPKKKRLIKWIEKISSGGGESSSSSSKSSKRDQSDRRDPTDSSNDRSGSSDTVAVSEPKKLSSKSMTDVEMEKPIHDNSNDQQSRK